MDFIELDENNNEIEYCEQRTLDAYGGELFDVSDEEDFTNSRRLLDDDVASVDGVPDDDYGQYDDYDEVDDSSSREAVTDMKQEEMSKK